MKQIPHYDGLYGETHTRPDSNYIFSELLETRSKTFNWVITPHVHTHLYQMFFIEEGQVLFKEATQETLFDAPCALIIPPTLLHGLSYSPNVKGRILTVSESVIEPLLSASTVLFFSKIQRVTLFDMPYSFSYLIGLIHQIDEEIFNDRAEKRPLLNAYLQQLLIIVYRLLKLSEEENCELGENITLKYFRQFQKSIKNANYNKTIPEYAQDLGITPVHLNRICQSIVHKSALQLIQENLIQEAQKYLMYTSYSVSEIAYLLQFEYPNYFAKLFKKHTGLSPSAFREQK